MRVGTPEFKGERLKAAREARGLSGAALSELTSVTRSALSQYERGEQTPSPSVLHEIANALNLPPKHFCVEMEQVSAPVFYRSFASTQKRSRVRAERKLEWVNEIVAELATMVEFPKPQLPCLPETRDPLLLTMDEVDDLAMDQSRTWFDWPRTRECWSCVSFWIPIVSMHSLIGKINPKTQ